MCIKRKIISVLLITLIMSNLVIVNAVVDRPTESFDLKTYSANTDTIMIKVKANNDSDRDKLKIADAYNLKKSNELTVQGSSDEELLAFDVRYLIEFASERNDVKRWAQNYFRLEIKQIVQEAENIGYTIKPDLDDMEFQEFAKSFYLSDNPRIIELMKFIDIYENYECNKKMRTLAQNISEKTYSSYSELENDESLNELYCMMPIDNSKYPATRLISNRITLASLAALGITKNSLGLAAICVYNWKYPADINGFTSPRMTLLALTPPSVDNYSPGLAATYVQNWWNKTNNTAFPYYARYYGCDETNNDMWSGGTGEDYRPWQDCADFVSQCLWYGGCETNGGNPLDYANYQRWFYNDIRPSNTWGGAANFMTHWAWRCGVRPYASETMFGDPVSVDIGGDGTADHTVIITYTIGANGDPYKMYFSCHTSDQQNEKTLGYLFDHYSAIYVYNVVN